MATAHGQAVSAAIARYQRGLRLGGDAGATLCQEARDAVRTAGVSEVLLQEDAARRQRGPLEVEALTGEGAGRGRRSSAA